MTYVEHKKSTIHKKYFMEIFLQWLKWNGVNYLKLYTLLQLCKKDMGWIPTQLSSMYGDNVLWQKQTLFFNLNKLRKYNWTWFPWIMYNLLGDVYGNEQTVHLTWTHCSRQLKVTDSIVRFVWYLHFFYAIIYCIDIRFAFMFGSWINTT